MTVDELDDIALDEKAAVEQESPFRRRTRAVPVRRGRLARIKRLLRWSLPAVLTLLLVGYGGYRLAGFAMTSPRFTLRSADDVLLTGNQYVTREEVLNALGIPPAGELTQGVNILRISLEEKRRQLEAIPWVLSATLTRSYPNRLAVHLVERAPVAFVNVGGRLKLVDREGLLLEKPERASFDFPVLTGLEEVSGRPDRAARLSLYAAFMEGVKQEATAVGWVISEVDLADADDLKALMAQDRDTYLLHFGHASFAERFQNFLTLLPELHKSTAKIDSIDLRYGNQIVVSPQEEASQSAQEPPPAAPPPGTRAN